MPQTVLNQLLLTLLLLSLIGFVVGIGWQLWSLLAKLNKSAERLNTTLDGLKNVTATILPSIAVFAPLLSGLKSGFALFSRLKDKKDHA